MGDSAEMERAEVRGCFKGFKEGPSIIVRSIIYSYLGVCHNYDYVPLTCLPIDR